MRCSRHGWCRRASARRASRRRSAASTGRAGGARPGRLQALVGHASATRDRWSVIFTEPPPDSRGLGSATSTDYRFSVLPPPMSTTRAVLSPARLGGHVGADAAVDEARLLDTADDLQRMAEHAPAFRREILAVAGAAQGIGTSARTLGYSWRAGHRRRRRGEGRRAGFGLATDVAAGIEAGAEAQHLTHVVQDFRPLPAMTWSCEQMEAV